MQSQIEELRDRILDESSDVILKSRSAVVNSNVQLKEELDSVRSKLSNDVTKIEKDLHGAKSEVENSVVNLR